MTYARCGMLAFRTARRIVIAVIGGTLLVVALVLFVTPGPGIAVLALALAVLSAEFAWARRWLNKLKDGAEAARHGLANADPRREAEPSRPGHQEGEEHSSRGVARPRDP